MATAEQMAESIRIEGHGVFALLWDAKEDLVRALLGFNAVLHDLPKKTLLLAPGNESVMALRGLIETRVVISQNSEQVDDGPRQATAGEFWILFLQQASSDTVGPALNGWRGSLRQPPGTLLVIRHADFEPFQRWAPDLASFIGPRIFNASSMLSIFSELTYRRLEAKLPEASVKILAELPGTAPDDDEIRKWVAGCSPADE